MFSQTARYYDKFYAVKDYARKVDYEAQGLTGRGLWIGQKPPE